MFLTSTDIGRNVYAVGGNERAARLSGIATRRVSWMLYMLSGALAAMGGLVIAARTGSANAEVATQGYELRAITAGSSVEPRRPAGAERWGERCWRCCSSAC